MLSSKDLEKADEIFEETAKHLLSKFNSMMNKYTYLLIMESMVSTLDNDLYGNWRARQVDLLFECILARDEDFWTHDDRPHDCEWRAGNVE